MTKRSDFPEDFLWGTASSSSQYEGGYNLNGKGLTTADVITAGNKERKRKITWKYPGSDEKHYSDVGGFWGKLTIPPEGIPCVFEDEFYPSHDATKGYEMTNKDLCLLHELGVNAYRMSISWARIFPNGDDETPNKEGLDYYRYVFRTCRTYGITPIVTLYHYDCPLQLTIRYGGWKNRRLISFYERYARTVFREFHEYVKYWITFNEINSVTVESFKNAGMLSEDPKDLAQAAHNELVASARAVKAAHEINPNLKVGCMAAYTLGYAETCSPDDQWEALLRSREYNFYLDVQCRGSYPSYRIREYELKNINLNTEDTDKDDLKNGCVDYISFSYYATGVITARSDNKEDMMGPANPYLRRTAWGWGVDPKGLRLALNQLYERYGKPLMIVENGLGADDVLSEDGHIHDDSRIEYIRDHISEIHKAIKTDAVDVIGYNIWASVDFISLGTGEVRKRYGLIYADINDNHEGTYRRIKKDSFEWYRNFLKGGE